MINKSVRSNENERGMKKKECFLCDSGWMVWRKLINLYIKENVGMKNDSATHRHRKRQKKCD